MKRIDQKYISIGLSVVNLVSTLTSVLLIHYVVSTFTQSIEQASKWAAQIDDFASIVQQAGDADTPGNDVFEHHDVRRARAEEATSSKRLDETLARVRANVAKTLGGKDGKGADPLLADLDDAAVASKAMHHASVSIFDNLDIGDRQAAGGHMATMDQEFARIRAAMERVRVTAVQLRGASFAADEHRARRARWMVFGIAFLGIMLVLAVRFLGNRLVAEIADGQASLAKSRIQNADMKFLLDNVGQGFVTVDASGQLSAERSAILERWFGPLVVEPSSSTAIWDYIGRHDRRAGDWLSVGWDELFNGVLPFELAVDQLPKEIRVGAASFKVEYLPLFEEEEGVDVNGNGNALVVQRVGKVVLIVSDITSETSRREAETLQSELAALVPRIAADPMQVATFLEEGNRLVGALDSGGSGGQTICDTAEGKRMLHTLKGNASVFGLQRIAQLCHELEDERAAASAAAGSAAAAGSSDEVRTRLVARLVKVWRDLTSIVQSVLDRTAATASSSSSSSRVDIHSSELQALAAAIRNTDADAPPREEVAATLESWLREPMSRRLAILAEHARTIAARLSKKINVVVEPNGVRLDAATWAPFWSSIIHVIRNAVDHGIEGANERVANGKSEFGKVTLRTMKHPRSGGVTIEIEDDGRGIDVARLEREARKHGIIVPSRGGGGGGQLVDLVFVDGLSTRSSEVSSISGRGIGLGAVRAACIALGGTIEIRTVEGKATTFAFHFPPQRLAAAA